MSEEKVEVINYYLAKMVNHEFVSEHALRYVDFINYPYGDGDYNSPDFVPEEVLDAEIKTVKNALFWDYERIRINRQEHIKVMSKDCLADFLKFAVSNIGVRNSVREEINLKNQYIFSDPRVGERLHKMLAEDLDFMSPYYSDYSYYMFKNLGIGIVMSNGNHRMFAQTIKNDDKIAKVDVYDDLDFLKRFKTDGMCIYEIENPDNKIRVDADSRIPLLFLLTQIKSGIVPLEESEEYVRHLRTDKFPYSTEKPQPKQKAKPKKLGILERIKKHVCKSD